MDAQSHSMEKRSGTDRRKRPTSPLSLKSLKGRRHRFRREEDQAQPAYVDRYAPSLLLLALLILIFSVLDAFMTLELLSLGSRELNPIMDYYLSFGSLHFFIVKYSLTAFGVVLLVVHHKFALLRGRLSLLSLLYIICTMYGLLVAYEVLCLLHAAVS